MMTQAPRCVLVGVWHHTAVDFAAGGVRHRDQSVARHAARRGTRDWYFTALVVVPSVAAVVSLPLSCWAVISVHTAYTHAAGYLTQARERVAADDDRLAAMGRPTVALPAELSDAAPSLVEATVLLELPDTPNPQGPPGPVGLPSRPVVVTTPAG